MKRALAIILFGILAVPAFAGHKTHHYDKGTFRSSEVGSCSPETVGMYIVRRYYVQTDAGTLTLITYKQAQDCATVVIGFIWPHARHEKPNPLDSMETGDAVAFRIEQFKDAMGIPETDVYIPDGDKETKFYAIQGKVTP